MSDEVMEQIGRGIALVQSGDGDRGRALLEDLWHRPEVASSPLRRCTVAHFLADAQDEPARELEWDLAALEAAGEVTDDDCERNGMVGGARALYPSLHLNLADVWRRLGNLEEARRHVTAGSAHVDALADDGYGRMIAGGLARLASELGGASPAAS